MKKNQMVILIVGILGFVLLSSTIYNVYKGKNLATKTTSTMAVYIDNELVDNIPTKNSNYFFERFECDEEITGVWNNYNWSLELADINKPTKCKIYFRTQTFRDVILKNNKVITKDPLFTVISNDESTGLYKGTGDLADEYGETYYFRGTKTLLNNNVLFGGHQWKILRINGDGTVRLIYNGPESNFITNKTMNNLYSTTTPTSITNDGTTYTYAYNTATNRNAYMGYMYGAIDTTSTYNQVHANTTDSNAKQRLDIWYENNLYMYKDYIADNIFCNDRSLFSGTGISNTASVYNMKNRLNTNKTPTLKCAQVNDQFTLTTSIKGNKKLTYPIGLITADEVALAGGIYGSTANTTYYLYTNQVVRTMSPDNATSTNAILASIAANGSISGVTATTTQGLRPVISLKADVLLESGDGSETTPYKVKTKNNCENNNITNFKNCILANNVTKTTTPTFTAISTDLDTGLYKGTGDLEDEYGETYYFRGNKILLNNNVIFAGHQWKILRINGDGTARLVYNGPESNFTTNKIMNNLYSTTTPTSITNNGTTYTYAYNTATNRNAYMGYMYGAIDTTSTYNQVHANTTDSNAKVQLDTWYRNNIANLGTTVTSKIEDNIFCNDRSLFSGTGISNTASVYNMKNRLNTNKTPTLKCAQVNDQFTLTTSIKGNKKLTYPIGLITADEVALAGGIYGSTANTTYYLYTNQVVRTMSPDNATSTNAILASIAANGSISGVTATTTQGLRPIISLKTTVTISSGTGTLTDPFIVN